MKESKSSCRDKIKHWFTKAPAGAGVSLQVYCKWWAGVTKQDLAEIGDKQVDYIFDAQWGAVHADELPYGLDLYCTALAMHRGSAFALRCMEKAVGMTGFRWTKELGERIREGYRLTSTDMVTERQHFELGSPSADVLERIHQAQHSSDIPQSQSPIMEALYKVSRTICLMRAADALKPLVEEQEHAPTTSPSAELENKLQQDERCCGNCCWSSVLVEELMAHGRDQAEHTVCCYEPSTVVRLKRSVCHHHARTTGWGRFSDSVYLKAIEDEVHGTRPEEE